MFAEYLKSIPGIETIGIAGLLLTFAAFVVVVIRTVRADRNYIREMSRLPLDDNSAAEHHLTER